MTNSLKFGTILVATDLQGNNSAALRYAQAIASQHGSTVVILYVIDPVGYAFPNGSREFVKTNTEASDELKRIEDEIGRSGIAVRSVVESGAVCDRILHAIKEHNADLLILGTKAKTNAGRVALGIVARRLLARSSCPILTVPRGAESLLSTAECWRRVLVATDFSASSLSAVQCAHRIVRGELLVVHASGPNHEKECPSYLERLRFLAPLNESHTVPVEHIAASGDIGKLVSQLVLTFKPDLIVLGAPESDLTPDELGASTVMEIVSGAFCPVLCVPAQLASSETTFMPEVIEA